MNQPVAVGDDGRAPGDGDGPLLAALRGWAAELRAEMRAERENLRLRARQAAMLAQPAYAPLKQNGTIDANGNLVLDLGGPQLGRRWAVRMIAYSDAGSYWSTMSASAALCLGQKTGSTVPPDAVRWPFSSSPNAASFGADQIWVNPSDHVLLSITGGTAGQNVQCTIMIQDFTPESPLPVAEI